MGLACPPLTQLLASGITIFKNLHFVCVPNLFKYLVLLDVCLRRKTNVWANLVLSGDFNFCIIYMLVDCVIKVINLLVGTDKKIFYFLRSGTKCKELHCLGLSVYVCV